MPYYEYKGKIDRVLYPIVNNHRILLPPQHNNVYNNYIAIYFKIDKKDIIVRNDFRYITCITYNGYPNKIPADEHTALHYENNGRNINPLPEPFPLDVDEDGGTYIEINPNVDNVFPGVKLCLLYKYNINSDYYLRIFVPLNDNSSNGNNFLNIAQSLKPGVNLEVVFRSETNPTSDNTAALITFTNDADAF